MQRCKYWSCLGRSSLMNLGIAVVWAVAASTGRAGPLEVEFDTPAQVTCRPVTPEATSADTDIVRVDEQARIIEARFPITTRVTDGSADDLSEIIIEIRSRQDRLQVVGYCPETLLEPRYS